MWQGLLACLFARKSAGYGCMRMAETRVGGLQALCRCCMRRLHAQPHVLVFHK